jgi:hypothetical protein
MPYINMSCYSHSMVKNQFKEEVNELFNRTGQSGAFDYDSYDWGCLRYMIELWIFLNRLSKQNITSIRGFFNTSLIWLSENEELRKYDGQDYTAASMLSFFLFAKLARLNIEEALEALSSNKSWMKRIGFEKVPTKGAVTKFKKRMDADFNRFFGDFIDYTTDCMDFDDLDRYTVVLFTKCYFGGHESRKEEQLRLYTAANQSRVHRQDDTGLKKRLRVGRRTGG